MPVQKSKTHILFLVFVALALLAGGTFATIGYRNYGSGRVSAEGWIGFTPPDGSFTVELPGEPTEEPVEPIPTGSLTGGKRYTVTGFSARRGYDLVSGVGTVDAAYFVPELARLAG